MELKNSYVCFYCAKKGIVVSFPSEDEIRNHMKKAHNVTEIKSMPAKLILNHAAYAG